MTAKSDISLWRISPHVFTKVRLHSPLLWETRGTEGSARGRGGQLGRLPAGVIPGYRQRSVGPRVDLVTIDIGEGEAVLRVVDSVHIVQESAGHHLGLPPGHGAGGRGGREAVQRRHGLGPGVTRTLNSNFIKISALITTRPGALKVGYTNTLAYRHLNICLPQCLNHQLGLGYIFLYFLIQPEKEGNSLE